MVPEMTINDGRNSGKIKKYKINKETNLMFFFINFKPRARFKISNRSITVTPDKTIRNYFVSYRFEDESSDY